MQTLADVNAPFLAQWGGEYTLVPGEGSADARLMLVGEAPGRQEAEQGRPFVGTAGKNLDAFLEGVHLARGALYITNAVKFRPTRQGASGRLSNRTPARAEVDAFRPWLLAEIARVRPAVIATLGNTALYAVTGGRCVIGDVHGAPLALKGGAAGAVVFPLYHPASIIYRRELRSVYEEDVRRLRDYMRSLS